MRGLLRFEQLKNKNTESSVHVLRNAPRLTDSGKLSVRELAKRGLK
jgi:hypothetical protein